MKFREHRGGLGDSMTTVVEVDGWQGLLEHMRKLSAPWPTMPAINDSTVKVRFYADDERIGWKTHVVMLEKYGVFGFTDAPCSPPEKKAIKCSVCHDGDILRHLLGPGCSQVKCCTCGKVYT